MAKKTPKPEGIPLESLFGGYGFQRNFEMLMRENTVYDDPNTTALKKALITALVTHSAHDVNTQLKHAEGSAKGGKKTAEDKADALQPRNEKIEQAAHKLLSGGRDRRSIAGILAPQYGLKNRQVRNILKKAGI